MITIDRHKNTKPDSYTSVLRDYLNGFDKGATVSVSELACILAQRFGLEISKATAATNVAMSRLIKKKDISFRRIADGLYLNDSEYVSEIDDVEQSIKARYLDGYNGYNDGKYALYEDDLCEKPSIRVIVTNRYPKKEASTGLSKALGMKVYIKKPPTRIDKDNLSIFRLIGQIKAPSRDEFGPMQDRLATLIPVDDIDKMGTLFLTACRYYDGALAERLVKLTKIALKREKR